MRVSVPFYVNLALELEEYLRQHPEEIPAGIDSGTMRVLCDGYIIPGFEGCSDFNPHKDTVRWKVRFGKKIIEDTPGHSESREYTYLITYLAIYQGRRGIVAATLA